MTQEEVAFRADLSARGYAALERGQTFAPSLVTLHAVAEALEVDLPALFKACGTRPRRNPIPRGRRPKASSNR